MKLPRILHHIWATINGYFWMRCPLCGKMFGGHEWSGASVPTDIPRIKDGICPDCEARGYSK